MRTPHLTPVYYSPDQVADHGFISIRKLPAFIAGAQRTPLAPTPFTEGDFKLAHKAAYVQDVLNLKVANGFGTRSRSINHALAYSNASLWAASEHVLENGGIACSASQGFHHASHESNFGYCTFNGLVIAARKALKGGVGRVLIIDGDAHYGDGTDSCIQALRLGRRVVNITRDRGIGAAQAGLNAQGWAAYTHELLQRHRPGLVLYQAGADAWVGDPYGSGYLSFDEMRWRDQGIFAACLEQRIPIAWNLAGGYSDPMDMTVAIHLQTLKASDDAAAMAH